MVAGLLRKSRNASTSNHFMATRPSKQHEQRPDLTLPDFPSSPNSNQSTFVLRPKNVPIVNPSFSSSGARKVEYTSNNKRPVVTNQKVEKSTSLQHDRVVINEAKRRYVLRPQIAYTANSINMMQASHATAPEESHFYSPDEQVVSGILDGITSLCLGPTLHPYRYRPGVSTKGRNSSSNSPRRSSSPSQRRKKKVVYPIASYPARLNCQKLVSERRAVFQQNLFRPVSSDELSFYAPSVHS
ncbi:hypothetical protein IV203_038086 [Nitzschia inconspicua]|uniref:Uncharacterized protein n=1 Tax=Nitzschia inconspicua TaxID=303405 RepID=A0A9K3LM59_9STRA|nr:hypothetical protein IV203_038086 [Nitzschia inconspicua]